MLIDLPEIARRIADPLFTKNLYVSEYHLGQFVEKREQLLLEVIQGLDPNSKAALGLIYMRKDHLESPITLQGSEPLALERLDSTLGGCIKALDALNGSLVTNMQIDDQSVWRFKHPTIGDAYASTLAFSPDLLGIFLSGSSTENLTSQVTCGNVGVEKAVVVSKSLFPMMVTRLLEFSTSDKYKTEWMAKWGAKRTLQQFLANRCSQEFLSMYLEHDPELVNRIAEPGLFLDAGTEVRLVVRLHKFDLFPEQCRKKFVETVSDFAIKGYDMYALRNDEIRSVFTDSEFDEFVQSVRSDLLPRLSDVRREVQGQYESSGPPDEHMQLVLESFNTLKKQFSGEVQATQIIEREMRLAEEWIVETKPPEPKVSPRTLGIVEPSEETHGTRSIFDDIDDGDA